MNKRVAKPKRKLPLIPDENVSDAQMEKFVRDNREEIAAALREAKAEMDAGKGTPVESLEHFLNLVRGTRPSKG